MLTPVPLLKSSLGLKGRDTERGTSEQNERSEGDGVHSEGGWVIGGWLSVLLYYSSEHVDVELNCLTAFDSVFAIERYVSTWVIQITSLPILSIFSKITRYLPF